MIQRVHLTINQYPWLLVSASLGLWCLLISGLVAGDVRWIYTHTTTLGLLEGIHGTFALIAAAVAVAVIAIQIYRNKSIPFNWIGPLGFTALYCLIGIIAAWRSPDPPLALQESIKYMAVPLTLWAIVSGSNCLNKITWVIRFNWVAVCTGVLALFMIAVFYLNLDAVLLNPSTWIDCELDGQWYVFTDHVIRPTGVGRFASITAVISISGLCQGKQRLFWSILLIVSIFLVLTSGSRAALIGLICGSFLVVLLSGGKKAVIAVIIASLLLTPIMWLTGIHKTFLDNCFLHGSGFSAGNSLLPKDQNPSSQEPLLLSTASATKSEDPTIELEKPQHRTPIVTLDKTASKSEQSAANNEKPDDTNMDLPFGGTATEQVPPTGTPFDSTSTQVVQSQSSSGKTSTPIVSMDKAAAQPVQPTTNTDNPNATEIPYSETSGQQVQSTDPSLDITDSSTAKSTETQPIIEDTPKKLKIPDGFFTLTGRTVVWDEGLKVFKRSVFIGHGFHGDRLVLGTHAHNTLLHALIQTGIFGTVFLLIGLTWGWLLIAGAIRNLNRFPAEHKHTIIQLVAIGAILSLRTLPESTGAYFNVDWLLLAPLLLYIQVVTSYFDTPAHRHEI